VLPPIGDVVITIALNPAFRANSNGSAQSMHQVHNFAVHITAGGRR
jgi:hypothetical protein